MKMHGSIHIAAIGWISIQCNGMRMPFLVIRARDVIDIRRSKFWYICLNRKFIVSSGCHCGLVAMTVAHITLLFFTCLLFVLYISCVGE